VLLSDIPENLEVAEDCAPSFRTQDVDDLTDKLAMLIRSPEVVKGYEGMARGHIAEHYSWDKVTAGTEAVYLDLVTGGAGKKR
jgi:glycosyltransferase involved in cell wall biosynthesis